MANRNGCNAERYHQIDFFRGAALLIIFIDHFSNDTLRRLNFTTFGFSDAAEAFVFWSGFVSGLAYAKVSEASGYLACQLKSVRRFAQLYFAHILTLAIVLTIFLIARNSSGSWITAVEKLDLDSYFNDFFSAAANTALLAYLPRYSDILPLYMFLILLVPAMLAIARRSKLALFAISFCFYMGTQELPWLNIPTITDPWYFNPFAWQFLFVIGLLLSRFVREGKTSVPFQPLLVVAAVLIVTYSFVDYTLIPTLRDWSVLEESQLTTLFPYPFTMTFKESMQPSRLIHFFSIVYLVIVFDSRLQHVYRNRWMRPFLVMGRNSLWVFCAGVVLSCGFMHLLNLVNGGVALMLTGYVLGGVILGLFAELVQMLKIRLREKPGVRQRVHPRESLSEASPEPVEEKRPLPVRPRDW